MSPLVGHAAAAALLREAALGDRLHHAWLITGPQGIGKARFADEAARWLLATAAGHRDGGGLTVAADHPTARLIAAGSHPDHYRLERLAKDKGDERARSIAIDQVRALQSRLGLRPSLSERRVAIVDAVDDLERAGANALLKSLEEPPAGTLFLLVSHAPGRLLPTIRSRCRTLRLEGLADAEVSAVLEAALPEADAAEIAALGRLAGGAPGAALRFAGLEVAALDAAIDRLAVTGDPGNGQRSALARVLAPRGAQARYHAFLERAPSRIAAAARAGEGDVPRTIALWGEARAIADSAIRQSADPQATVFELAGLVAELAGRGGAATA